MVAVDAEDRHGDVHVGVAVVDLNEKCHGIFCVPFCNNGVDPVRDQRDITKNIYLLPAVAADAVLAVVGVRKVHLGVGHKVDGHRRVAKDLEK